MRWAKGTLRQTNSAILGLSFYFFYSTNMANLLEIDGAFEEGGGQILRNALAISVITQKPFLLKNIRAKRNKPGLKPQHLKTIHAVTELTGAKHSQVTLGSTCLEFYPRKVKSGRYRIEIGTAGSVTLLLQALIPAIILSNQEVELLISGGTNVKWSQPWEHFEFCLLPYLNLFYNVEAKLVKRGYYPKGNGLVWLKLKPPLKKKRLIISHCNKVKRVFGVSHASARLRNKRVAERQADAARAIIEKTSISCSYSDTSSVGSGITIVAEVQAEGCFGFIGCSALGERGKPAEVVGRDAALKLKQELGSNTCLDEHLADQLLIYLAFNNGSSIVTPKITGHIKSGVYVINSFIGNVLRVAGYRITAQEAE